MNEIVKHIRNYNASYREIGVGDAKNTDLCLDNEYYQLFEGLGDKITVRFNKENLSQAIMFIASILPKKYDLSSIHKIVRYSKKFVLDQLSLLDALFMENGKPVNTITQEWNIRKGIIKKNGEVDPRFYFNGLFKDVTYTDNSTNVITEKFIIRNYLVGGYSDLHIQRADNNIFDITISNTTEYHTDEKEDKNLPINVSEALQQIYYGAPGTGKSYRIKNLDEKGEEVIRTTFHPDSDYSTFVGSYKPTTIQEPRYTSLGEKAIKMKNANGEDLMEDRIVYKFVAQAFLQAYVQAWRYYADAAENEPKKQFLVIEEINRGNCAQIFGDLFQLLDRNEYGFSEYYINADTDLKSYLAREFDGMSIAKKEEINGCYKKETDIVDRVLSGDILLLPNNLYIWATMNTSDQSLFPIDSAFKRRWDWVYIPIANVPEKKWKIVIGKKEFDWWGFIEKINAQIGATTNSEDKKLGFFFCQANDKGEITVDTFVNKVVFYLWNDVFKDYGFDNDLFKIADDKFLTFDKFYKTINGKTEIEIDNVQLFLSEKLGLSSEEVDESDDFEEEDDDDDDDGDSTDDPNNSEKTSQKEKDYSRYSINGVGRYNKREVIIRAVEKYVADHTDLTSEKVLQNWIGLTTIMKPNPFPKPFILSNDKYEKKKESSTDNRIEKRFAKVAVGDDSIYVSNQMRIDTFDDIIEIIKSQDWDIHIEKVE